MCLSILILHTSPWPPSPLKATSASSKGLGERHGPVAQWWHPALGGEDRVVSWSTSHIFCISKKKHSRAFDSIPFPACRTTSNQMAQEMKLWSLGVSLTAARSASGRQQNQRYFVKSSPWRGEA